MSYGLRLSSFALWELKPLETRLRDPRQAPELRLSGPSQQQITSAVSLKETLLAARLCGTRDLEAEAVGKGEILIIFGDFLL